MMVIKPSLTKIVLNRVKRLVGFDVPAVEAVTAPDPWEGMPPAQRRNAMREYLADAFRSGLTVIPSETSRLVTISYISTDPEMAAIAANATAEAYILDQIENKGDVTARASRWIDERVKELRDRVVESETKLEQYRAQTGLLDIGEGSSLKTRLSKLEAELSDARTRRAEAQARFEQVQALLKDTRNDAGVALLADVPFDGPVVETLRQMGERWDGAGQPRGLAGSDILATARIVSVANAFVAMLNPRAWRPGASFDDAVEAVLADAGSAFDRSVVVALVNRLENRGGRQDWAHLVNDVSAA